MKIVHVYKHAAPDVYGGIEFVVDMLAQHQSANGHEVHVLGTSKNGMTGHFNHNGYKVTLLKKQITVSSTPLSLSFFWHLAKLSKHADIIHIHYPYPFADLCMLLIRSNAKVIVTYHSDIIRQYLLKIIYFPIQTLFLNKTNKIIATSPNYFATSKTLSKYQDKVDIIPLGANDIYLPSAPVFKKPMEDDYFLFVGEFRYYKGLHTLINAASHVKANIIIIGAGPLERELSEMASKAELKNVKFIGRLDDKDKHQYFQHALGVVFPSHLRSEAFGITLVEGAMHGKPLISCEIGTGTSYVNIHNETGIVCPPNNPLMLANALTKIYENPSLAKFLGKNARRRFEEHFTSYHMAKDYEIIYEQLSCYKQITS